MVSLLDEWLFVAEADLASAKFQLGDSTLAHISVYQSHQAVEKMLKAFLVANNFEAVPRIHDLRKLYHQVKLLGLNLDQSENDLLELDSFFPKLRYPIGDRITIVEATRCYEIASAICEKVKKIIKK